MASIRSSLPLIPLRPFPLASIILLSTFLAVSLVTVGVRTYIRCRDSHFGLDDAFILVGTIPYIVSTILGVYCFLLGSGSNDSGLETGHQADSFKHFFIWTWIYALSLAILISSTSLTLRRITSSMTKYVRVAAYVLLAMAWCFNGVVVLGASLSCGPVVAGWKAESGQCASDRVLVLARLGPILLAIMAVLLMTVPGVVLWRFRINRWKKWQVLGLLVFGSIAFIFTLIQIPYSTSAITSMAKQNYWHGITILLSNMELGVGCIASSVPAVWWSLFARKLSGQFQSPSDVEQMSLSLLEMREAEGWGLQRKQWPSYSHAIADDCGTSRITQSPATPSYQSMRTKASNQSGL